MGESFVAPNAAPQLPATVGGHPMKEFFFIHLKKN